SLLLADGSNTVRQINTATGFFPIGEPAGSVPTELVQLANPDAVMPGSPVAVPVMRLNGSLAASAQIQSTWSFIVPAGVKAFEFTVTVEGDTQTLAPPQGAAGTGTGSQQAMVRTVAGAYQQMGFIDGPAILARFSTPGGIVTDGKGNIY